ncbi:MAG: hypothetical protein ACQEXE_21945 [Bacillota bacterium]
MIRDELAYSYTSQCEKEYEWWWEGGQTFGDGYEQEIAAGHQEGLLACFEDSYSAGTKQGYSDYIDDYVYDEYPTNIYDESSYGKGSAEGWAEVKE